MKVAIEGCAHGELEAIYDTISLLEEKENIKVDLLIICGDFQATRNEADLHCMAIPQKYYSMCSFYKYYNGEKTAPILTIFVGGNHEASNYLQELPYGGWVAPNIYYMGYSSVLNVAGVRIGGISGIYKPHDYQKGRFEKSPYSNDTKRSVYHIRNLDVFRLKQVTQPIDIFISHDWPTGIHNYGNSETLLKLKPYFKDDMESGKLGSKPCEELLKHLQPKYYFAAHLHCKFAALVQHDDKKITKFLALDKCLPKRRFLQITDIPHDPNLKIELQYDLDWLTILFLTNHLISVKSSCNYMPGVTSTERWQFTPTEEEKALVSNKFLNNLVIPNNFVKTTAGYTPQKVSKNLRQPLPKTNSQTTAFSKTLNIDDPLYLLGALSESDTKIENDSTDECTSGEDESDMYETFIKSTPSKLSLSLPKPKYDLSNAYSDSGDLSAICKDTTSILHTDADVVTKEGDQSNPSHPKKFKRRNASLYSSEDVS